MTTCIGNDPLCPCQDGLACHYKDYGKSKGWPIPKPDLLVDCAQSMVEGLTMGKVLEYGKAERERALEEAALLCDGIAQRNWATTLAAQCADAIRALKTSAATR